MLRIITDVGMYGVQLFFIISGFLAAKSLDDLKKSTVDYYKKRAVQILPLYILVILWYFITENILDIYLHQIPEDVVGLGWFRYILFLNGFVNSDTYFWSNLGITWTIPIFVAFYITIPWIERFDKTAKNSVFLLCIVIVLSWLCLKFYTCTILKNMWIFYVGVCIFHMSKEGKRDIVAGCFLFITLLAITIENRSVAFIFLFAAIFCVMLNINDKITLSKRTRKIIDFLDERSYTIYLVHGVVFCSLIDRLYIFDCPYSIRGVLAIR